MNSQHRGLSQRFRAYRRWTPHLSTTRFFTTHLLVAAASILAFGLVFVAGLLVFGLLPESTQSGTAGPFLPVVVLAIASTMVAAAVATISAWVAGSWLFDLTVEPLRTLTTVVQRLAKGHYAERVSLSQGRYDPRNPDDPQETGPGDHTDNMKLLAKAINELAESLEATERHRTESFGEVAHELRTPVAVLEGYFEGLLDGHVKPSAKIWAMLFDEASRVHRLVDDLQGLSRAEARQEPPDLQSVGPGTLAQAALERMQLHFAEKGLQVDIDIAPGLPRVLADPDYTLQVLVNMLTNSLRYTNVPGKVTLSVERMANSNEVVFHVADTGVGIAAEHVPHLFDRFFRVDRSGTRGGGGSGIGLPVAKALVEAMGGQIWADSPGVGHGSIFSFTLLIAPDPTTD